MHCIWAILLIAPAYEFARTRFSANRPIVWLIAVVVGALATATWLFVAPFDSPPSNASAGGILEQLLTPIANLIRSTDIPATQFIAASAIGWFFSRNKMASGS